MRKIMKRWRLVVVCNDAMVDKIGKSILYTTELVVVLATEFERRELGKKYSAPRNVDFYKSIKDRHNKHGSFYDTTMLVGYSRGESVKPYEPL